MAGQGILRDGEPQSSLIAIHTRLYFLFLAILRLSNRSGFRGNFRGSYEPPPRGRDPLGRVTTVALMGGFSAVVVGLTLVD